jgi:hypothetical protein
MNSYFSSTMLMCVAALSLAGCFGSNAPNDIPDGLDLVELCSKPDFAAGKSENSTTALKTICPCVTDKAAQIGDAAFKDIEQKALSHAGENGAPFGLFLIGLVNQSNPAQIANVELLSNAAKECRAQY